MIRTTPFWETDISEQLLKGVITPLDIVESSVLLTLDERQNLEFNTLSEAFKYLTIYKPSEIPAELKSNFDKTTTKLSNLEDDYNYNLLCTSFYRSMLHHLRVYAAKGIIDPALIPLKSKHLVCLAGDLVPEHKPIKHFHDFLTEAKLEEHGLWMEHPLDTPKWGHLQSEPYPSWVPGKSRKYRIK